MRGCSQHFDLKQNFGAGRLDVSLRKIGLMSEGTRILRLIRFLVLSVCTCYTQHVYMIHCLFAIVPVSTDTPD